MIILVLVLVVVKVATVVLPVMLVMVLMVMTLVMIMVLVLVMVVVMVVIKCSKQINSKNLEGSHVILIFVEICLFAVRVSRCACNQSEHTSVMFAILAF